MSNTFCIYPWINIHSHTDGRCKLCCHIYEEDYLSDERGNLILGHQEFDEIWNGTYMQQVREKMLAGQQVKACERCYQHEQMGMESSRQWANKEYAKNGLIDQIKMKGQGTLEELPTQLELRLGNTCNLKCNSCWSVSSNSIYKERKRALEEMKLPDWLYKQWEHEVRSVQSHDWSWYKTEAFKDFIRKSAKSLKRLYLTGGEPTLIPENYEVIRELLNAKNNSCHVAWTTNLTHWPEKFYEMLNFFDSSEIQMSIDGYGDASYYIRYPTRWAMVEKNFRRALKLNNKVSLKIYCVIQAWNILDLSSLINWLTKESNGRRVDFVPIFLEHPIQIHSCIWPNHLLEDAISALTPYLGTDYDFPVRRIIEYIENSRDKVGSEQLQKMKEFIEINDRLRKINFSNYFPNLHQILMMET